MNTQKLYSIAYMIKTGKGRVIPQIEYLHADSSEHARIQFCVLYPNRDKYLIVAIGPVIGYNALDDNGDKVSV